MASIRFLNGPREGQHVHVLGGEICGRDENSDIQILVPGISRRHCQFVKEGRGFLLCDLGSMNRTYVNQAPISRHQLINGDTITVGGVHFQFASEDELAQSSDGEDSTFAFDSVVDADDPNLFLSGESFGPSMALSQEKKLIVFERRLQIFHNISQALGSVQNTNELLNRIMLQLFEAFPQADRGLIMVGDSLETLVAKVVHYRNPTENTKIPVSQTVAAKVFLERKALFSRDVMDDSEGDASASIMNQFMRRSLMCAPLVFKTECMGYIQIDSKGKGRFDQEDLNLLTGISAQAAIFLQNDRLNRLTNLERYFPKELAGQILNGHIDLKPGGDLKTGTVFFSDLIGFTSMSELIGPHQVINLMNRYFEIMVNIILKHRGYIDKFIGDAIMAVWGAPAPVEDEVYKAITAAIEMQNALYLFSCELIAEGGKELYMAIGLNSGRFIAGNLGSDKRMEYTVLGDAVNLAQRVESKSVRGAVFISESTYERIGREVIACRLLPSTVKGKRAEVTIYSVRGVPTDGGLFLMSLPFLCEFDGQKFDGLLVKAKYQEAGVALLQILLPRRPNAAVLAITFVPPEIPSFTVQFAIQREVPLKERFGVCLNGSANVGGTPLEELLVDHDYISPRSPDDMPRKYQLEVWHYEP